MGRKITEDREPVDSVDEDSVDSSPIQVLHSQTRAQAGLGFSKPPKKRLRTANVSRPVPSDPSDVSQEVSRPKSVVCKKKSGSCNHEVVFDNHYNKAARNKYAQYVRTLKNIHIWLICSRRNIPL